MAKTTATIEIESKQIDSLITLKQGVIKNVRDAATERKKIIDDLTTERVNKHQKEIDSLTVHKASLEVQKADALKRESVEVKSETVKIKK